MFLFKLVSSRIYTIRLVVCGYSLVVLTAVLGCGTESVATQPSTDQAAIPWKVTLNTEAATMSIVPPYDTLRLAATVRNAYGDVIVTDTAPTFTSTDPEKISVTSDGLVTVHEVGVGLPIVASYTTGLVTLTDTLYVDATNVTDPPTLATFKMRLDTNQITNIFALLTVQPYTITPIFISTSGDTLSNNFRAVYTSSNPGVAYVGGNGTWIQSPGVGPVMFYAKSTVYGVTKIDSLPYTATLPLIADVLFQSSDIEAPWFSPGAIVIKTGGTVIWLNLSSIDSVDVTFDDPAHAEAEDVFCNCGAGNIPVLPAGMFALAARKFTVPGTYYYSSTIHNIQGRIVVRDE